MWQSEKQEKPDKQPKSDGTLGSPDASQESNGLANSTSVARLHQVGSLQDPFFKLVSIFRLVLACHIVIVNLVRAPSAKLPWLVWLATGVIITWTLLSNLLMKKFPIQYFSLLDFSLSAVLILLTRPALGVKTAGFSLGLNDFVWLATVVCLVFWYGTWAGVTSFVCLASLNLVNYPWPAYEGITLLIIGGLITWLLGSITWQLVRANIAREENLRFTTALAERERLNRILHDGVLQVLALVERQGTELGPRGKLLATLARQQEIKLRAMLQDKNVAPVDPTHLEGAQTELTSMLEQHQTDTVTVSTMADKVMLETTKAKELNAAVVEILSNVAKHAGAEARAWVLVELDNSELIVSIRDNGVGIEAGQLAKAMQAGRLGVKESVVGRIEAIGGNAKVTSKLGAGVEWEIRLPIPAK